MSPEHYRRNTIKSWSDFFGTDTLTEEIKRPFRTPLTKLMRFKEYHYHSFGTQREKEYFDLMGELPYMSIETFLHIFPQSAKNNPLSKSKGALMVLAITHRVINGELVDERQFESLLKQIRSSGLSEQTKTLEDLVRNFDPTTVDKSSGTV